MTNKADGRDRFACGESRSRQRIGLLQLNDTRDLTDAKALITS